jgi:hypothetical protein
VDFTTDNPLPALTNEYFVSVGDVPVSSSIISILSAAAQSCKNDSGKSLPPLS